jgi:probable dihydroxyacetone kinase regulator
MNPDMTRQMLEQAMVELLSTKPIEKISVNDIVKKCGMSRQTFYNYCTNKYELIQQVYCDDFDRCVKHAKNSSGMSYIVMWYNLFLSNRKFYLNAFSIAGYGSLTQFLVEHHHRRATQIVKKAGIELNEKQKVRLKLYNYGSVMMIRELLMTGTRILTKDLEELFFDTAPEFLQKTWGFYTERDLL